MTNLAIKGQPLLYQTHEHELKMVQLKRERELLELERKHELDMLKLRGGCLGRIFGCK